MNKFIDLTGKKFGRLTALKRVEDYVSPKGNRETRWLCKCDCGNNIIVLRNSLTSNNTKSCGCLNTEKRIARCKLSKKYNTYDLTGEYGIGYTSKGEEFYFDLEDYDKIKNYCWIINNGYVVCSNENILMHRLIMGHPYNMVIDHIHGEKTRNDNRKFNLRICEQQENIMNCRTSKNNKSGVTGVSWHKRSNRWCAYIMINYKKIHLGCFDSFEDAVKARKNAENKYFGEYSYDNSQKKGVNRIV